MTTTVATPDRQTCAGAEKPPQAQGVEGKNSFDHVHHDILMHRLGQTIRDRRVLRLIGRYLRSGVMINGVVAPTEQGTPQGGPLSPLLANLCLDALDQDMAKLPESEQ